VEEAEAFNWIDGWAQQRYAMIFQGRWATPIFLDTMEESGAQFEFDVAPIPQGALRRTVQYSDALGILRSSEAPDAAFKWIEFLTGEEGQQTLGGPRSLVVPANLDVAQTLVSPGALPENARLFISEAEYGAPRPKAPHSRHCTRSSTVTFEKSSWACNQSRRAYDGRTTRSTRWSSSRTKACSRRLRKQRPRLSRSLLPFVPTVPGVNFVMKRIPVVDITDLYHPYQDADDNLDLLLAYGLPEVELLGVVLDCHQPFREPVAPVESEPGLWADPTGPRDPGFIPVMQLNYIFDRSVPCATGPFVRMRAPDDPMWDAPAFQQQGIELLLQLLNESPEPVHIVAQGSGRPLAVAYNRAPELFHRKVARLHLCMGATAPGFLEWNVALDVHAAVRLLRSDLPIALYPPATEKGPFEMGRHNCYWHLETLEWVNHLHPKLKRYLDFVYSRAQRMDFLRAMEQDFPAGTNADRYVQGHHLWTTAMWMEVTGRRLAPTGEAHSLLPPGEAPASTNFLPHALRPCELEVAAGGRFTLQLVEEGRHLIYDRKDPAANARALNEAFPILCCSFAP
jgi:hypothetical protein